MIREKHGNLLAADVDALVNTVNTVGAMGKGIALQFKRAYPEMFKDYASAVRANEVRTGRMHVWATNAVTGPRYIINFPTKQHWRRPSELSFVAEGLEDLVRVIGDLRLTSVAVPPLGCGNGGLSWDVVRPMIEDALGSLAVDVWLYPPEGAPPAREMVTRTSRPTVTRGRAAMLRMMKVYQARTWFAPSIIEVQKLMYLLQAAGEPLRLTFVKRFYGPYSDQLRHVMSEMEGHYLSGFGDGSAKVNEAEPLELLDGPEKAVEQLVATHPEMAARMEKVLNLVAGFETPYGLELLASIHYLGQYDDEVRHDSGAAVTALQQWSERKAGLFSAEHVVEAWQALERQGWLEPLADSKHAQTSITR